MGLLADECSCSKESYFQEDHLLGSTFAYKKATNARGDSGFESFFQQHTINATRDLAAANFFNNARRADIFNKVEHPHHAAPTLDHLRTDDLINRIITALHQHIGTHATQ